MINFKEILSVPKVYSLFQKALTGKYTEDIILNKYIRAKDDDIILDIGCGPADILDKFPKSVKYYGYDLSEEYIEKAKKKYSNRNAVFIAEPVTETNLPENLMNSCDIVLALGVLHHLSKEESGALFMLAKHALKKGGRLITIDPYVPINQKFIAKLLTSNDRGQYIRKEEDHINLAKEFLGDNINIYTHDDFLKVPYNNIVIEWEKEN